MNRNVKDNGERILEIGGDDVIWGGRKMSRREFLRLTGMGAVAVGAASGLGGLAGSVLAADGKASAGKKSTVLIVRHPKIILNGYKADPAVLDEMISVGVQALSGKEDIAGAWGSLFRAEDRVCMKRNRLSAPTIWTHRELDEVITNALVKQVKIERDTVAVWDPHPAGELGELSEPFYTQKNRVQTRIFKALSAYGTALINLPILKTHGGQGVTISLKNHLGTINNPGDFHRNGGWKDGLGFNIADLNVHPAIKDKTRLIVVDAIRPLYDKGPSENPSHRWDYNALIMGTDTVAVDRVGLQILEAKRQREKMENWQLGPGRKFLAYAEKLGLGNSDPDRIKVLSIDLGQEDGKPREMPLEKVA